MPPKTKTITKNQRKVGEKILLKNNKNKKLHDKIDSSYDFLLHRRQHFLFRREIYNYTCKSPYIVKFRNICFQSSGSRCLVKGFLYKYEVFPSPLIQICLQFKGILNVDWTSNKFNPSLVQRLVSFFALNDLRNGNYSRQVEGA